MSSLKIPVTLSLVVLMSVGAVGCNNNTSAPTPPSSVSTENQESKVDAGITNETAQTLTRIHEISTSKEYNSIPKFWEMMSIEPMEPDVSGIEKAMEENPELFEEINSLVALSPEKGEDFTASIKESMPDISDETVEGVTSLYAVYLLQGYSITNDEISFGLTSDAIYVDSEGTHKIEAKGVYMKDANNAILDFPDFYNTELTVENDGKKVVIGENPQTDEIKEEVSKVSEDIEQLVVSIFLTGETGYFAVEDNTIVLSQEPPTGPNEKYVVNGANGITVEVTGDTSAYKIVGSAEGSSQKAVYQFSANHLEDTYIISANDESNRDFEVFHTFNNSVSYQVSTLEEYISAANNLDFGEPVTFSLVHKGGEQYVKVDYPETKVTEKELLYRVPLKFT